jgi:hypothetical protein
MLNPVRLYVLLFSLYWAQGLPVGFMTHALPVILRSQGVSLTYWWVWFTDVAVVNQDSLGTLSRSVW